MTIYFMCNTQDIRNAVVDRLGGRTDIDAMLLREFQMVMREIQLRPDAPFWQDSGVYAQEDTSIAIGVNPIVGLLPSYGISWGRENDGYNAPAFPNAMTEFALYDAGTGEFIKFLKKVPLDTIKAMYAENQDVGEPEYVAIGSPSAWEDITPARVRMVFTLYPEPDQNYGLLFSGSRAAAPPTAFTTYALVDQPWIYYAPDLVIAMLGMRAARNIRDYEALAMFEKDFAIANDRVERFIAARTEDMVDERVMRGD